MKKIRLLVIGFICFFAVTVFAGDRIMPRDQDGKDIAIQVMTINDDCFTSVTSGNIDVKGKQVVVFSADCNIYEGTNTTPTWPYTAGDVIGIGKGVTSINIDTSCVMWSM